MIHAMKPPLVLASTSVARRALLSGLGVRFEIESPDVDETLEPEMAVDDAVRTLSLRKVMAVRARRPDAWVLGSDQLVSLDGALIGKPTDRAQAKAQISQLLGRTHVIATGVALVGPDRTLEAVERTKLTVYPLGDDELERYLDLEEWRGCAGSYRIEGAGQALFSAIDGDRTNVQGLPMLSVVRLLREAGFRFFDDEDRTSR